jgi:hypothetical protein
MRRVFGPRTVVEAAFLVAVPVVAAALGAGMWTIIGASAVAYLLIFLLEATLWREGAPAVARGSRLRRPSRSVTATPLEPAVAVEPEPKATEAVLVLPSNGAAAETEPVPEPVAVPDPPVDEVPAFEPPREPSFTAAPPEHVRVLRPEPPAEREPEPPPGPVLVPEPVAERPQLTAVPELQPLPEPPPVVAAPAPEPSTVVPIGVGPGPRRWNLWDLERLTREHAGGDVVQDEERQFLLMYLREFADTAGLLPIDFDGLVRDSFGELVGAR